MWTEKRRVATRDGELAVVDAGVDDAPPVLLLHGFATSSYLWRHLIPLLAPWMRVIAPDALGAGDSEMLAGVDHRLVAERDRTLAVLDALEVERFAVIGHARGGGVAQLLALDGRVDALCLIDTVAFDAWPSERVRALQRSPDGPDPASVEAWIRDGFDLGMRHRERLSDTEIDEYLRPYGDGAGAAAFVEGARGLDGHGLSEIEPGLAELDVPALVLWGEEDPFLDVATAERLGEVLPRAAVAILPGCGHFLLEDAADTVAPLIFQWLRSQYLKVEHRHEPSGPVVVSLGRRPEGEEG